VSIENKTRTPPILRIGVPMMLIFGGIATIGEINAMGGWEKIVGNLSVRAAYSESPSYNTEVLNNFPENIRRWSNLILEYSEKKNLDPVLIAAVMLTESEGDPTAYSKSGAVGLLQVMPCDGIAAGFMCENGPCFTKRPTMAELYDPRRNVDAGTDIFKDYLSISNGNEREALRLYGGNYKGNKYYYADKVLQTAELYR